MDVDYLSSSSSTEARMDLVTIMTEMEKLSQLSEKAPLVHHQPFPPCSNGGHAAPTTPHALVAHQPPSLAFISGQSRDQHRHHLVVPPVHINSPAGGAVLESWNRGVSGGGGDGASQDGGGCGLPSVAAMREMIFHIAAMQPIHIDPESVRPPKRRNVKISKDPQSVAARHRRERISERIRILQQLVPGGTKMDTASMLDEAIHYMKFLKTQVQNLERAAAANRSTAAGFSNAASGGVGLLDGSYSCYDRGSNNCEAWDQGFAVNTATSSSDGEPS